MEFENYWGLTENFQEELRRTDNIFKIMDDQCKYLFQYTKGNVFAVFGEIKLDGSMFAVAKIMANVLRGVSGISGIEETIAESSTKKLIDASDMYFFKRYGFEVCTEKYRFRLFELRVTPIYPVEIIVDEGICKNIGTTLMNISVPMEKANHFQIGDEETFCNVLQNVLKDRKVRYIIEELQKRVQVEKESSVYLPQKVIICEGKTDEIILNAIARKLEKKIMIVVANGKYNVPAIFDRVREKNTESKVLIVVDSDGMEAETRKTFMEKIDSDYCQLTIINNCIEDWFMPEVADFSKLKLMQSIDSIIKKADFVELRNTYKSFDEVIEFIEK